MSLLTWLFPKKKLGKAAPAARDDAAVLPAPEAVPPTHRKTERMARRELLYSVVRDSMVRAGVLSASYKFKVLSLDSTGRQFLLMVDLARESGREPAHLAEIEAMIAQGAKARHGIVVKAVYWRMTDRVVVGQPGSRPGSGASQPAPPDSLPPVDLRPAPLAALAAHGPYEPIQSDEVEAFKRALAAGVPRAAPERSAAGGARARAFDGSNKQGPRSYTLLTGFEDTEMPDAEHRVQALSSSQYGDLR